MLFKILNKLDKKCHFSRVSAHCDIPCKIYDPISAQLAVLTMIRLVDLLNELADKTELSINDKAQFNRLISEKEMHGHKVKEEIRIIWGDYFKQPQLDLFPEVHDLVHSIMLKTSAAKQHVDKAVTLELLDNVNRFAEVFWATKGIEVYNAVSPYPPSQVLVYPKLD